MTVRVETEQRQVNRPNICISEATNIVSLYSLSHLLQCHENLNIYYETGEQADNYVDELVKKICPRALRRNEDVVIDRSIIYLREGMDEELFKSQLNKQSPNPNFILIISLIGIEHEHDHEESSPLLKLENEVKSSGYDSYCVLRLPPVYQDLSFVDAEAILDESGEFYGCDADDISTAISHILFDPELHQNETYTIYTPSSIPTSTLKAVHSQLPKPSNYSGNSTGTSITSQPPATILANFINNSNCKQEFEKVKNDFGRITGGAEEMTSFDEFLRRTSQSLFHQRFISRD